MGRRPCPHHLAQDRELADVVSVVVGDDPDLAQERVPRAARDDREQVATLVGHHRPDRGAIGKEARHARIPGGAGRGRGGVRPVLIGPRSFDVVGVRDVVEDVRLGQAEVLDEVPWGVVDVRRPAIHVRIREVCDGRLEGHVSVEPVEQSEQFGTQRIAGHGTSSIDAGTMPWLMPARPRYRGDANAHEVPRNGARASGRRTGLDRSGYRHGERARPVPTIDRRDDRARRRIDRSARAVPHGGAARELRSVDLDDKETTWRRRQPC